MKLKIYKIVCTHCNQFNIGSTKQKLCQRLAQIKEYAKTGDSPLFEHIREVGNSNFKIVLLDEYDDIDKEQLKAHEEKYIDELQPTLTIERQSNKSEALLIRIGKIKDKDIINQIKKIVDNYYLNLSSQNDIRDETKAI